MLQILRSKASSPNPHFTKQPRKKEEDNVAWLSRLDPGGVRIIVVGGRDHTSFRVRVAQSHARDDMTPSHWSHAALVVDPDAKLADDSTQLHHVPLEPSVKLSALLKRNGVETTRPSEFKNVRSYPNIAVLRLEAPAAEVKNLATAFRRMRASTDAIEHVLGWLAFVCGVGRASNPLVDGIGLPSAVLIELALGGAGFELTPGLPNRASCPEGIWQAAKWWHEFHAAGAAPPAASPQPPPALQGSYCIEHSIGAEFT